MSTVSHTDVICRNFCTFFKEGKEDMQCGTYRVLASLITASEIENLVRGISPVPEYSFDARIAELVCSQCDFLVDGCDFRDGLDSPACGGYVILEHLIRAGRISLREGP